jgi:hypothetical protein
MKISPVSQKISGSPATVEKVKAELRIVSSRSIGFLLTSKHTTMMPKPVSGG